MVRGLEHTRYWARLKKMVWFKVSGLITVFNYLKESFAEVRARLSSEAHSERTRCKGQKLQYKKFQLGLNESKNSP